MAAGCGLAGLGLAAGPAPAVDGDYCIVNRADRSFQINRGTSLETLAPGRKACCTDNCRSPVWIGFDVSQDPAVEEYLLRLGLAVLSQGRLVPPGQPTATGSWIPICRAPWRRGDQIEVYSPNEAWRCDVVDAGGSVRESIAAAGRRPASDVALRVCNQAADGPAWVAKAWSDAQGIWISDGWYEVPQGRCEDLPLPAGYRGQIYTYAETQNLSWPGEWNLCVDPGEPFEISNADRGTCGWRYEHYPFFERSVDGRGAEVILSPE